MNTHRLLLVLAIASSATTAYANPANVRQIAYGRHMAKRLALPRPSVRGIHAGADGIGLSAFVSAAAESGFEVRAPQAKVPPAPEGRGFRVRFPGLVLTRLRFESDRDALTYALHHADLGESLGILAVRGRRVVVLAGARLKDPRFALRTRRMVLRGLGSSGARLDAFTGPWEVGFKVSRAAKALLPTLRRLQALGRKGKVARGDKAAEISLDHGVRGWISTGRGRAKYVRAYYRALVGGGQPAVTPTPRTVSRFEVRLAGAPKGLTQGEIRLALAGKPYLLAMRLDKDAGFRKNNLTARYTKSLDAALRRGVAASQVPTGFKDIMVDVRPNGDYVLVLEGCPAGVYEIEGEVRQRGRLPVYLYTKVTIDAEGATTIRWAARSRSPRLAKRTKTLSF